MFKLNGKKIRNLKKITILTQFLTTWKFQITKIINFRFTSGEVEQDRNK